MAVRTPLVALLDIERAILEIEQFTAGKTLADYARERIVRLEYDEVSPQIVWNVLQLHLPPLMTAVRAMIRRVGGSA